MKVFTLTFCLALLAFSAHAETLTLVQPVTHFSSSCGYAQLNQQTATGFSLDGNYVYVTAHGRTACGHSGRGATTSYVYWCESLTYDLSGNLVDEYAIVPKTSSNPQPCPWADPTLTFANIGGYQLYTESLIYNWTITVPILDTP